MITRRWNVSYLEIIASLIYIESGILGNMFSILMLQAQLGNCLEHVSKSECSVIMLWAYALGSVLLTLWSA